MHVFAAVVEQLRLEGVCLPDVVDDAYCTRFLRARGGDVQRAQVMLMAHIHWRKEQRIDEAYETMDAVRRGATAVPVQCHHEHKRRRRLWRNIHDEDAPSEDGPFVFDELQEVLHMVPTFWHKTDRFGRPVWYQRLTDISSKRLWAITTKERYVKWQVLDYERLIRFIHPKLVEAYEGNTTKLPSVLSIFDLKDLKMSQWLDMKEVVVSGIRIASDNYPEMLGAMYVLQRLGDNRLPNSAGRARWVSQLTKTAACHTRNEFLRNNVRQSRLFACVRVFLGLYFSRAFSYSCCAGT